MNNLEKALDDLVGPLDYIHVRYLMVKKIHEVADALSEVVKYDSREVPGNGWWSYNATGDTCFRWDNDPRTCSAPYVLYTSFTGTIKCDLDAKDEGVLMMYLRELKKYNDNRFSKNSEARKFLRDTFEG